MWYSFWRNPGCEFPSIWTWPSPHSFLLLLWHLRSYRLTPHFLRWFFSILLVPAHLHRLIPVYTTWFKHLNLEFENQTGWSKSLSQSKSPLISKFECITNIIPSGNSEFMYSLISNLDDIIWACTDSLLGCLANSRSRARSKSAESYKRWSCFKSIIKLLIIQKCLIITQTMTLLLASLARLLARNRR